MIEKKVQKRTIESRDKLNKAAWKLFSEKGYFNTNTKEIAKLAGVSVGNFYNYYKDKAAIYYELAAQYVDGSTEAVEKLDEVLMQAEDKREALAEYIYKQMDRATATGRFFSDFQVLVQDDEKLQALFQNNTDQVIQSIESLLKRISGVKIRASYPVMARVLFTMIDGLSADAGKVKEPTFYEEYRDQLIQLVQNYIFGEASENKKF